MNIDEIKTKVVSVVNALNSIEVKGRENLVNLSGSIGVLVDVYNALSSEATEKTFSQS